MNISTPERHSSQFQTVGIIGKYAADVSSTIALVLNVVDTLGATALIDIETTRACLPTDPRHQRVSRDVLASEADIIVAVGGDGSFLGSGRSAIKYDKPIIGVNMGRLGFLTDISPNEIQSVLYEILIGKYLPEARTVLSTQVVRDGRVIASEIAINDVVIHKRSVARMVELEVYLDNHFLSVYFADGLIVSSPTGSTAYALSSGGPILQGNLEALTLVPISPHSLTQRPIVIDAKTRQRIEVSKNNSTDLQISIDGQTEVHLHEGDSVLITQYEKKLNIYHPCDYDQLKRWRHKLGWGSEGKTL